MRGVDRAVKHLSEGVILLILAAVLVCAGGNGPLKVWAAQKAADADGTGITDTASGSDARPGGEPAAVMSGADSGTVAAALLEKAAPMLEVSCAGLAEKEYGEALRTQFVVLRNVGSVKISLGDLLVENAEYFNLMYAPDGIPASLNPGESLEDKILIGLKDGTTPGEYATKIIVNYAPEGGEPASAECEVRTKTLKARVSVTQEIPGSSNDNITVITTNKIYDGTTHAEVEKVGEPQGILSGDDVLLTASAEYDSKDAGYDKTIRITYALEGADAWLYEAPASETRTGWIEKAYRDSTLIFPQLYVGEDPLLREDIVWENFERDTEPQYLYKRAGEDEAFTEDVPREPGNYTVMAILGSTVNYHEYDTTADFEMKEFLPAPPNPYSLLGEQGPDGWYRTAVRICPPEGYRICSREDGKFAEELTALRSGAVEIALQSKTGAKTDFIPVQLKIDTTAPACGGALGGITIGVNNWRELINQISFGLFLKDTVRVDISAEDPESGIDRYEYYISESPMTLEQLKGLDEWKQGSFCNITPQGVRKKIIYARITNKAGLSAYLSSNGLVFDTEAPRIEGVPAGQIIYAEQASLVVGDDYLETVTVDEKPFPLQSGDTRISLPAADGHRYLVEARDRSGNVSSAAVQVREPWVRDGLTSGGPRTLRAGMEYRFGGGSWTVEGDSTVYMGNRIFFATETREYEFTDNNQESVQ